MRRGRQTPLIWWRVLARFEPSFNVTFLKVITREWGGYALITTDYNTIITLKWKPARLTETVSKHRKKILLRSSYYLQLWLSLWLKSRLPATVQVLVPPHLLGTIMSDISSQSRWNGEKWTTYTSCLLFVPETLSSPSSKQTSSIRRHGLYVQTSSRLQRWGTSEKWPPGSGSVLVCFNELPAPVRLFLQQETHNDGLIPEQRLRPPTPVIS